MKNILDFKIKPYKIPKINLFDYTKTGKKIRTPIRISTQKEIYIRARGKCEKCKKPLKGIKPHIHHKDRNPKNNNKNNLILVCPNCHSKIHLKDKLKKKGNKKEKYIWDLLPK